MESYSIGQQQTDQTLNLKGDNRPSIINSDYHYIFNDETYMEIRTNWQSINICLEAYDKSTGKKVFSKSSGWDYTYGSGRYIVAPENCYYSGPYYNRCMEVIDYILEDSGYDKEDSIKNNIKTIKNYTFNRLFLCVKYNYSMNAKKNLGFFENEMYMLTGSGEYLDP